MSHPKSPTPIEKESISKLQFPSTEVLSSTDLISSRRSLLEKGTALGNSLRRKVKILFEDQDGIKKVETTIWATTEKNIVLKGGVMIPITRIHRINLY